MKASRRRKRCGTTFRTPLGERSYTASVTNLGPATATNVVLHQVGVEPPAGHVPAPLETSVPGVFAAGDVRLGSMKRIAAAVGEGSTVIRMCHQHIARRAQEAGEQRAAPPR